ncbi:esterase [Lithospermum erythrorhizon]|uniref:Pectinesterase n=1 Tax=Lithospermum erythrorhizon TaxID=34254 RepID=A0AAV3Q7S9_LITER
MSPKLFSLASICCILFTFSQSSILAEDNNASSNNTVAAICKSTPYPSVCYSVLPNNNSTANVYDYGRFSVRKSLSCSLKFLNMVDKYLQQSREKDLTVSAIRALEDCKLLAELNLDFLSTSFQTVEKTSKMLPQLKANDVQTLLSAILTNTQTCLDGLQATESAWRVRSGLSNPLSNYTRLYSVSLALFTKAWVPETINRPLSYPTKHHNALKNGRLSLKMSAKNKAGHYWKNEQLQRLISRRNLEETMAADDNNEQVLVSDIVVVSQDGTGNFTTITQAVDAAPNNTNGSNGYFLIYVMEGVYEEYILIAKNKKYLLMIGDGINNTIITGNHSVIDGWTTFNSFSFAVVAQGFVAVDMTFRNTAGPSKHQAVAVRNGADLSTFYRCSFEGYQDTLYVHSLRQFYRECDIYGTVDFIFGNAASLLQNCNIYPRLPLPGQFNAITAQGRTDPNQNTGISIHNCTIRATDDLSLASTSSKPVSTYLGRPWKEYSRTVYMQTFLDNVVHSKGWHEWSGDFALNTSYYAEFDNTGPGSNFSGRVTWPGVHFINSSDAANFTVSSFLVGDDWLQQTGVPYSSGLL